MNTIPINVRDWGIIDVKDHPLQHGLVVFSLHWDVVDWFEELGLPVIANWTFDTEYTNYDEYQASYDREWILQIPEEHVVMFKLRWHP